MAVMATSLRQVGGKLRGNRVLPFMTTRSLLLVLLSVPSLVMGCITPEVPLSITKAIEHDYPSWTPVALSNLGEYERNLWLAKTNGCPGSVTGHFVPGVERSYAFALTKKEKNGVLRVGVVYWVGSDNASHSQVFVPAANALNIPVVWKLHGKRSASLDEIVWEVIEVGSSAYRWRDGRFVSRVLSY